MVGQNIGYIRVSTVDQNLGRQLEGVHLDRVFEDKISGGAINRPGWNQCKDFLREGDTLYVHSIDRLARNLEDLQHTIRELTEKGVTIRFVKENLAFQGKDDPLQTLMFQMVGAFAQFERALIKERQREGIERAKKEGRYTGRPRKITDEQWKQIKAELQAGARKTDIAKKYGISREGIYNMLGREKQFGGRHEQGRQGS